jgi:uncharacterized protein (DUF58 family)
VITLRGAGLLLCAAVLIGLGLALGLPEAVAVGVGCVALLAVSLVAVQLPIGLRPIVSRTVRPSSVPAGSSTRIDLTLSERRGRRMPSLLVSEALSDGRRVRAWSPPIQPREERTFRFPLAVRSRGPMTIGPLSLRRNGFLGLASRSMGSASPVEVLGWPTAIPCSVPMVSTGVGVGASRFAVTTSTGRSPDGDFTGMRAYVPGDDLRRVDWRASARSTDLIVRTPEGTPAAVVSRVVLDVSPGAHTEDSFELALSVAASFLLASELVDLTITDGPTAAGTTALDLLGRLPPVQKSNRKVRAKELTTTVPLVDRIVDQMPERPILIAGPRTDPLLRVAAGLVITAAAKSKKSAVTVEGDVVLYSLDDLRTYFPPVHA